MNSMGQLDFPVITFLIVMVGLFILAPVMYKIFTEVKSTTEIALNQTTGGQIASRNFSSVMNTAINFWDKIIVFAFVFLVILMFVSAFMIDTHPFWVVLYIIIAFMLVIFMPDIIGSIDALYANNVLLTPQQLSNLSWVIFLRNHFGEFLVGIISITGIIMYGKISLFGSQGRAR